MTQIRYDIVHRYGGWCIACDDAVGPPYNRKAEATRDVMWVAELLRKAGDEVEVYVAEPGQPPERLELAPDLLRPSA